MQKSYKLFSLIAALLTIFLFGACSKKESFSLAQINEQKNISECQVMLKKKQYKAAISCFESIKSRNYGYAAAAIADLSIADTYYKKKEYIVAADAYNLFIQGNPYHEKVPYAYFRQGMSFLKSASKGVDRDQTYLDNALKSLETVVKYYRHTAYAKEAMVYYNEARIRQAKRHFYIGRFYYKNKEYQAAIPRFQSVVTDYPKLGLDEQSFYYLISALKKTNQKDLAFKLLAVFKEHYPQSAYVKRLAH